MTDIDYKINASQAKDFAAIIYLDIQPYIAANIDRYRKWLLENDLEDDTLALISDASKI